MRPEKLYRFSFYTEKLLSLFAALILIAFTSCKQPLPAEQHNRFNVLFALLDTAAAHNIKYTEADMATLDAAYAALPEAGVAITAKKYFYKIRYYRVTKNDFSMALLYTDSCISLLEHNTGNTVLDALYTKGLFIKGDICFAVKNYEEAVRNYTKAQLFLTANGLVKDSCSFYNYYYSMARTLYAQKKYLMAAGFFKLKYKWADCDRNGEPLYTYLTTQENMDNTGICFQKAGLADSAFFYFDKTLRFIDENEHKIIPADSNEFNHDRAVVYSNIAALRYAQNDLESARQLYLKSVELADNRDTGFVWPLKLSLAALYLNNNEWQNAGGVLQKLALEINTADVNTTTVKLLRLLSDYYIKTEQSGAANKTLQQAYIMVDSLEKKEQALSFIDVRREFESREQQNIVESLKKENQIKTGYLVIAVISTVLILVVIGMVWYNLNRKSHYVKDLTNLHTEVSQKNRHLQETLVSLEQSHKENNRIMRVVAHDLKNPLSAVRTLAYSLKKDKRQPNKENFELIESTCIESIAFIKDLLDNKRSMKDTSKELVDMGRLTEQCTELFRNKALEKGQDLKLQIEHSHVLMNRQKIWRVISNIISNAIKFSSQRTVINICLQKNDGYALLSVKDHGIGIPDDLQEKIFSLHADISRSGTAGEESYGMGLSISRKIVEEHGGRLWFESQAGEGSVFYVQLPYNNS